MRAVSVTFGEVGKEIEAIEREFIRAAKIYVDAYERGNTEEVAEAVYKKLKHALGECDC
jgi:hypothetical protein